MRTGRGLRRGAVLALAGLQAALAGCLSIAGGTSDAGPDPARGYLVYDVSAERFIGLDALARALDGVDVVLFGEIHDDDVGHRVQLELFDRMSERIRGTLGMEMFERDVQGLLASYLAGSIDEPTFVRSARAWSNYASDYRPLVEMARQRGWRVVGTNLPQAQASAVARAGLSALDSLSAEDRSLAAAEMLCPLDAYWTRFLDAMNEGADSASPAAAHVIDEAILRRTYEAQCARDETMAESIAASLDASPVLHVNGSFHSDHRLGIVPRLLRRSPSTSIRSISAIPIDDLADPPLDDNLGRADYLVFTRSEPGD